jgi:type VI secretion system ImpA family protein
MDMEPLIAPVNPDDRAGPDLSYSPERGEIERTFERAAMGDVDDGDWKAATATILAQSLLTKDLWLAVYLARAGARSGDLALVESGCVMLAELVERYWDCVHPSLEEYGIEGRKAPCESLVRIGEFLGPLRRAALVVHPRLGSFSGEDFERFAREGESATGYGLFRAALVETPVDELQAVSDRLQHIRDALSRVDTVLSEHAFAANQTGTNFEPAYDVVETIRQAMAPYVAPAPTEEVPPAEDGMVSAAPAAPIGAINNRDDVARVLDNVIEYYTRREPSSPIPEALRRIKGWINMDFMAILRDISPTGISDAEKVLRVRNEENNRSDMM